jgi:hypothetical protein
MVTINLIDQAQTAATGSNGYSLVPVDYCNPEGK